MIDKTILKSGDIFLFHTRGFNPISMAIRELTQSFFNHCGMYCEDVYKQGFIIEALGNGVCQTPVEQYLAEKHHIIKVVRLRQEAFRDIDEYNQGILTATGRIWGKIGAKYDTWAIIWLGFKYIFKGSYKKVRQYIPVGNPLQSREKFFCSELVCSSFYGTSSIVKNLFAGEKYPNTECSVITPKDIGKTVCIKYITGKNVA